MSSSPKRIHALDLHSSVATLPTLFIGHFICTSVSRFRLRRCYCSTWYVLLHDAARDNTHPSQKTVLVTPQRPYKRRATGREHRISATRLRAVRGPARVPLLRAREVACAVGEDSILTGTLGHYLYACRYRV